MYKLVVRSANEDRQLFRLTSDHDSHQDAQNAFWSAVTTAKNHAVDSEISTTVELWFTGAIYESRVARDYIPGERIAHLYR